MMYTVHFMFFEVAHFVMNVCLVMSCVPLQPIVSRNALRLPQLNMLTFIMKIKTMK